MSNVWSFSVPTTIPAASTQTNTAAAAYGTNGGRVINYSTTNTVIISVSAYATMFGVSK